MSACISREGEYSDHEIGDWCPRCGAFNEEAIVAERDALRKIIADARRHLELAGVAKLSVTAMILSRADQEISEGSDA